MAPSNLPLNILLAINKGLTTAVPSVQESTPKQSHSHIEARVGSIFPCRRSFTYLALGLDPVPIRYVYQAIPYCEDNIASIELQVIFAHGTCFASLVFGSIIWEPMSVSVA